MKALRLLRAVRAAVSRRLSNGSTARLHLLGDNEDLDPRDYPAIQTLIQQTRELHLAAPDYVARHGLDPDVFLPRNIWQHLHAESGFAHWSYDLVNYSRAVSPFSGFHLLLWGRQDIPGDIDEQGAQELYADLFAGRIKGLDVAKRLDGMGIPAKIRASQRSLVRFYSARKNMARTYDHLVARIPYRFRLDVPKRGGEIGIVHKGRIINPDVLIYQGRVNALYGSGALDSLDRAISQRGYANYLEIGPGNCAFARALRQMFNARLNIYLVDLPFVIANGIAYLSCADGVDAIGLATPQYWPVSKAYTFVPNYLLPLYADDMPKFDLVHNALSFNEMSASQVVYYLAFVDEHLASDGALHLVGGEKYLEYHEDALALAKQRLRLRQSYKLKVREIPTLDSPHNFFGTTR